MPDKRQLTWLTVSLTAIYALVLALALDPSVGPPSKAVQLLFWEGLFAGPLIIASLLSLVLARPKAQIILAGFALGYSVLTALTFYWTYSFEHDAQYQLTLFVIPLLGFPSIIASGVAAAMRR